MRRAVWTAAVVLACTGCDPVAEGADTETDGEGSTSGPVTTAPATTTTNGGQQFDQTLACKSWLDCLDETAQAQLADQYGAEGTCWTQTASIVESCDADCVQGFNAECAGGSASGGDSAGETTEPMVDECSLEVLAPGADSILEAGDEPALLPTEIGVLLERVCSCHVADLDAFVEDAPLYFGNARFTTYAEMQANFEGAPMYVEVGIRALDELNMPPTYYCGDAEFGSLHTDEYDVLQAWIEADAPDGAQWLRVRPNDLPALD